MPDAPLHALPPELTGLLRELSPVALAFSGGLDSRFLAHVLGMLARSGEIPPGGLFHASGPHVPARESGAAGAWAGARGLPFTAVRLDPLELSEVRGNTKERCYHCKRLIFTRLREAAAESAGNRRFTLCDGSNASDALVFRPGLRALKELGVRSPLAEAGLGKDDIRRLAALTGMDDPGQQARPCLLTRFAYGLSPTHAALSALERTEWDIATILSGADGSPGPDFRLRLIAAGAGGDGTLPYACELQVAARPDAAAAKSLEEAVVRQGFAKPSLVILDAVSGYYDRAQKA